MRTTPRQLAESLAGEILSAKAEAVLVYTSVNTGLAASRGPRTKRRDGKVIRLRREMESYERLAREVYGKALEVAVLDGIEAGIAVVAAFDQSKCKCLWWCQSREELVTALIPIYGRLIEAQERDASSIDGTAKVVGLHMWLDQ